MTRDGSLYGRLLGYVRPHARVFALAVLGMMLAAATEPLFPALIKPLLDGGFAPAAGRPGRRSPLPRAIIGIFVLRGMLTFTSSYCLAWVANRVVLDLRAAMFARLVRLPARSSSTTTASGALLSKVAYDVTGVAPARDHACSRWLVQGLDRGRRPARPGCSTSTGSSR